MPTRWRPQQQPDSRRGVSRPPMRSRRSWRFSPRPAPRTSPALSTSSTAGRRRRPDEARACVRGGVVEADVVRPHLLPYRAMRAAVFNEPRSISVAERPDAALTEPTDAVVRVVLACVCGSDLWFYRGETPFEPGPIGHEFIGVVEDVGADVQKIKKGDLVIAPFAFSDGTCPHCRR